MAPRLSKFGICKYRWVRAMYKMLDLYRAVAEPDTGFWITVPVPAGQSVSRDEWTKLMHEDPDHFQIANLTAEELTGYSMDHADLVERAVFVTRSDELLH